MQSMQTWVGMWGNADGTDIILVFFAYFLQPLDFSSTHSLIYATARNLRLLIQEEQKGTFAASMS